MFCRQMQTLVKSGIPLGIAIAKLAESTYNKKLSNALNGILDSLNQGHSLYVAMKKTPDIFSSFFTNLIKLGETTGTLDEVFYHLSKYLQLELDTSNQLKSALRYPIILMTVILAAIIGVTLVVIPAFSQLFKQFGATLPLPTRMLIAFSDFMINYWYYIVSVVVVGLSFLIYYVKTPDGSIAWAKYQMKIPFFGWLIQRIILARFTRLYALVLRAGLSAIEGIELVGESSSNAYFRKQIQMVKTLVGRGNNIANSISQTKLFPPLVLQMVALGEETGRIDELLDDVSDFYQRDVEYDLSRVNDIIEPVIMIVMGVMVLILALGVYMPIWSLAGQAGRGGL
jgi:MSHA biogenesis protein MshG